MTFIAPAHPADIGRISILGRKATKARDRMRIADEDGARRAVGADDSFPAAAAVGSSIEHLARIALG